MRVPVVRALELVVADPGLWFIAALGFLARGGILLFLVLIVQVPSPITVTLIFGVDAVTGTGDPSARLVATIAIAVTVAVVTLLAAVTVAAWTDTLLFARVRGADRPRAGRLGGLAWLQALGILPGLAGFVVVGPVLRDLAVGELLLPSRLDVPFVVRVLTGAQGPIIRALVVVAVFELLVTVATRVYLADEARRSTPRVYLDAAATFVRRPLEIVAAWALGWAVLIGALGAGLWAVALSWAEVRAVFLDASLRLPFLPGVCLDVKACPDSVASLSSVVRALGASALFAAVWIAALLLVGLASAFRSSLWTLFLADSRESDRLAERLATS